MRHRAIRILYLLSLVLFSLLCQGCVSRMFYHPDRQLYDSPDRHGLKYEEVSFSASDGTRLNGWFIPAVGTPKGTVIHLHGNAQNMTAHFGFVSWLPAQGFNLFVFDYRGYGKSAGTPSRSGLYKDCVAAMDYLENRPGIDHDRLLVLGQSLGGANAIVSLGSKPRKGVRAIVIDSTFSSYRRIVRDKIESMPVLSWFRWPLSYLLITDSLSPEDYVARLAPTPFLLIHGTEDGVIPYQHGKRLYDLAGEPKRLWIVEGGDHTSALVQPGGYRAELAAFFDNALEGRVGIDPPGNSHSPGSR